MKAREEESENLANEAGIELFEYQGKMLGSFEKLSYVDYQRKYEKIERYEEVTAERYFLSGAGTTGWPFKWKEPLSPKILQTIIAAKKKQKFVRFEIWIPYWLESEPGSFWHKTKKKWTKINNGIIVGFIAWTDSWGSVYERDGHIDEWGDGAWTPDEMHECKATYLICRL